MRRAQPLQQLLLLLLLVHATHLACSSPAAGAAVPGSETEDQTKLQHAVCSLQLRGSSSGIFGISGTQEATLNCTSESGIKVAVSTDASRLMQAAGLSEGTLRSINVSGVSDLLDADCKEHAASLRASGSHPLLLFCGSYAVRFVQPLVHFVRYQNAEETSAPRNVTLLAFAGMVKASISNGSFEGNTLGSILSLHSNASLLVQDSVFSSNVLRGSCINAHDSSLLHVERTAFISNIAYPERLYGGVAVRIAGSAQAVLHTCNCVNNTVTAADFVGDPALSISSWGGATYITERAKLRMHSSVLQGNTAYYGAGVWAGEFSQVRSEHLNMQLQMYRYGQICQCRDIGQSRLSLPDEMS